SVTCIAYSGAIAAIPQDPVDESDTHASTNVRILPWDARLPPPTPRLMGPLECYVQESDDHGSPQRRLWPAARADARLRRRWRDRAKHALFDRLPCRNQRRAARFARRENRFARADRTA